jgi:class 3 adenylate cyclase
VAALAEGGQILVTADVAAALRPGPFVLSDARTVSVKGIATPVEVVAVEWRSEGTAASRAG